MIVAYSSNGLLSIRFELVEADADGADSGDEDRVISSPLCWTRVERYAQDSTLRYQTV